jgi:murein DD-endopeptidase MepM/ murein hydrolase activator NlpD
VSKIKRTADNGVLIMGKNFSIIFFLLLSVSIVPAENNYSGEHKERVKKQLESDLKKKDAILKKMARFISESNSAVLGEGIKFNNPVEAEFITDIRDTEEIHTGGVIVPVIYGYVNTGALNMRSEDSSASPITGRLKFRQRVEIIYQSDKTEVINNMKAPWLLVQSENGDEGWVFGAYVSDDFPSEPDKDSGTTGWEMIIPAEGKITSRFGKRVDPVTKRRNTFHRGIDIAAPEGTPVYAAESGVVSKAEFFKNGYGKLVIIKHRDNIATYYGHLSLISVKRGARIGKGEFLGRVGSTGRSTGPHLHFEVRRGNQALDPESYIR